MNRRAYISLMAGGITTATAGCTDTASTTADIVEDRTTDEQDTHFDIELSTNGPDLLIRQPDSHRSLEYLFVRDGEQIEADVEGAGRNLKALTLFSCGEDPSNADITLSPGSLEVHALDAESDEVIGDGEWEYNPSLTIEQFEIATTTDYSPVEYIDETTPVFRIRNEGSGATCITGVEVTNVAQSIGVDVGGDTTETGFVQTGYYPVDHTRFEQHRPRRNKYLLGEEETLEFALGGLFTYEPIAAGDPTFESVDQIEQQFDVTIHTIHDRKHTTQISAIMLGDVVEISRHDISDGYRLQTVRFNGVD